ncbi:MAG: adenosine kinase [Acidimicrobiales bacterium]
MTDSSPAPATAPAAADESAPAGVRPDGADRPWAAERTLDVVGVGSPLVDVLAEASEQEIIEAGLTRGSMALVDLERAEVIHGGMRATREVSGGSAANTMAGVAALGGRAGFVGKLADDRLGRLFTDDIRSAGVVFDPLRPAPADAGPPESRGTGRCLVLVSGDAERTMATHLGAAVTISPDDVDEALVARAGVVYLEGYLWDLPPAKEALRRAVRAARAADGAVALSLSDPFCVERHQREFLALVRDDVDVLFGNEDEMVRLFGVRSLEAAVDAAEETGLLVAITRGADGAVVTTAHGPVEVPAEAVERVVDTTGAGDLFAAGFLYGLTHGADPQRCARLGALCAGEVIGHLGARPERDLRALAADAGLL